MTDGEGYPGGALDAKIGVLGPLLSDLTAATLYLHATMAARLAMAPTDLAALHQLAGGPLSHRHLGRRLGLAPASTTTVVDRLVGRGHAERQRDPHDARSVLVASTTAGRQAARGVLAGFFDALAAARDRRSPDEIALIATFLHEATEALARAATSPIDPTDDG